MGQFSVGQPGEIGQFGLTGQNGVCTWHCGSGEKQMCGCVGQSGVGGGGHCHTGVWQAGVKQMCGKEMHGPCNGVGGHCGVKHRGVKH